MGDWFSSFLSLFFPRCCLVCGGPLAKGEECLCTRCNIGLPRTGYHRIKNNLVEQLFLGKFLWKELRLISFINGEVIFVILFIN